MAVRYSFDDTSLAGRRLALLAESFAPSTAAFLRARCPPAPALAVDLGCGPGHTGELLAAVAAPREIVAIDASPEFVRAAGARLAERGSARVADVTGPLPELAAADVVFTRFLLTHLADPADVAATWLSQMRSGALLLVEEVDAIDCDDEVLGRYLELQHAMLVARGHALYVGELLAPLAARGESEVALLPVATGTAARMFAMNFEAWRDDPAVPADRAERAAIARGLLARADAPGQVVWHLRQMALSP